MTTNTDVHTCSYYCERPECVRRQRDELAAEIEALLAEVERLRADLMESDEIREKLGHLLTRTAAALKGEPPAGVWHSWHDLRKRAETSWQRGFQQGLEANRLLATQAMDALKKEREAHAETNRAMTEALLVMEEREQRDEDLLRQSLEALEEARNALYEGHPIRVNTQEAIAALRERLGEGA